MSSIVTTIFTQKNINDMEVAKDFFMKLNSLGLTPDKIGLFEPLKEVYSIEKAVEMWTKEEPGCYEDGVGMVGTAGGMISKTKEPSFKVYLNWWKHPNKKKINRISFYISQKTFNKKKDSIIELFKYTIVLFDAFYGYFSHYLPVDRQHVTGTIETRMPGVFWCNYFGNKYVDFFGKEKLLSFPWFKTDVVDNLGVMCFLTETPHKELLVSDEIEQKAQAHLGIDSFGDIDEYNANISKTQYKNVPNLNN